MKLTEDGILLRKRAEEILILFKKTKNEITSDSQELYGEISIGGNPTATLLKAASELREKHKNIQFHFFSGDAIAVTERLDHGSLDFAVLLPPIDTEKYEYILLPDTSKWGLLMEKNSPLAKEAVITREILRTVPLVLHQRTGIQQRIAVWAEMDLEEFNIAATYNVVHGNSIAFAKSGLGYFLAPRDLLAPELDSESCFRPLEPPLQIEYALVWKRHAVFSKAMEAYKNLLENILS